MSEIVFENVWYLYLIPLLTLFFLLLDRAINKRKSLQIPSIEFLSSKSNFFYKIYLSTPKIFRIVTLSSLLIVLSNPYIIRTFDIEKVIANNIVLALDISGSMLANDFPPNRLQTAINKAIEFVEKRKSDRISIVVYSAESFVLVPLTFQKNFVIEQLRSIRTGIMQDGTAIGLGIATAINALENSTAKRKSIILLTDGVNNSGLITPLEAAKIALSKNIRIYTVGIGSIGKAMVPKYSDGSGPFVSVDIHLDEETLKKIADITGGSYFYAHNEISLKQNYDKINDLVENEKIVTKITKIEYISKYFLFLSFVLLFIELILRLWLLRIFP